MAQDNLRSLEYWFNSDFGGRYAESIAGGQDTRWNAAADVSSLERGLHVFHARVSDASGRWSPVTSNYFIIPLTDPVPQANALSVAEYWFDGAMDEKVASGLSGAATEMFTANLDVSGMAPGLHTFAFRFGGPDGRFSAAHANYFIIPRMSMSYTGNRLNQVEYWFDDAVGNAVSEPLDPVLGIGILRNLDLSTMDPGLHTLSFRFGDATGGYSAATTHYVFIPPVVRPAGSSEIVAYRYWVNDTELFYGDLTPGSEMLLMDELDLRTVPAGEYTLQVQFQDAAGRWSGAIVAPFTKVAFPFGSLRADTTDLCLGDSLQLFAEMIDADSIAWNFGNEDLSGEFSPKTSWPADGSYTVSATVTDTQSEHSVALDLETPVTVHPLPNIDLGDDVEVCAGEEATLEGPEGMSAYAWNTGESDRTLTVSGAGRYILEVTSEYNCGASDSVDLVVHPLPDVSLGNDITMADTSEVTLDAGEGFTSYLWNGETGTSTLDLSGADLGVGDFSYTIEVENTFGCFGSDTILVTVEATTLAGQVGAVHLSVYPNPHRGHLTIEISESADLREISLVSLGGQVLTVIPTVAGQQTYQVDLSGLSHPDALEGVALLRLRFNDRVVTRKIFSSGPT